MDTEVLKEPRGFMRLLQWFFSILAFAICANYSTYMEYRVECADGTVENVKHNFSYPFKLGEGQAVNVTCGQTSALMSPPGDFASDAQFFVFTGVLAFISTMVILAVYVFFSQTYTSEDKKPPLIDFCYTVILAIFWLSASAAWANGLSGMKNVLEGEWIFVKPFLCETTKQDTFVKTAVKNCAMVFEGGFAGANVSVLLGFLNFFLWSANLWFLYKETAWFAAGANQQQQQQMQG